MTTHPIDEDRTIPHSDTPRPTMRRRLTHAIIGGLIVAAGIGGAAYFQKTAPRADKRPPRMVAPLVEVDTVAPGNHQVVLSAMGTVIPAREVVLESRVTGAVTRVHPEFEVGGLLKGGVEVLQIDRDDYALAVTRAKSSVVAAEYALKLEEGRQEIARREWEILNGDKPADPLDKELALRQPHLRKARADLASARANLEQARIDLARTRITVPFNAIVRSRSVSLGSQVAAQEQLAVLVDTDAYWVEISLPVDRLPWIDIPRRSGDPGADALVRNQGGLALPGRVIRLLSDLETAGRMARILVEIRDPLGLGADAEPHSPLILGEYVRVEIQGRVLENVFRIPRTALRDNARIWVAGPKGTLEIRAVAPLWRGADYVLLRDGLTAGEHLVTSDLAAAVEGMTIRVRGVASQAIPAS